MARGETRAALRDGPPPSTCEYRSPAILNILSLETSTEWCSAALWQDGRVLVREELAGQRHSELILPMIDELLHEAALPLAACDAIAFGAGPGSFTGLRIACGVTQGLAFAADVPVAEIGTLLAVAQASRAERVIACLDARMGEVYVAAYARTDVSVAHWQVVHAPRLCAPIDVPPIVGGGWVGAGSGFGVHEAILHERYASQLTGVHAELHPHAREIAELGAQSVRAGATVPAEAAHPLYLRDRVAQTVSERAARKAAATPISAD